MFSSPCVTRQGDDIRLIGFDGGGIGKIQGFAIGDVSGEALQPVLTAGVGVAAERGECLAIGMECAVEGNSTRVLQPSVPFAKV